MRNELKALRLKVTFCLIALLLSACVSVPSLQQRSSSANTLAQAHHWQANQLNAKHFDLFFYHPKHWMKKKAVLTVYIEGDGFAWLTKRKISTDPTPIRQTVLTMALKHTDGNVVYLARPCQYTGGLNARNCNKHVWTDGRFSEEVIAANNTALNQLKEMFSAKQLKLVGYSGGAAVAALLAARRDDVVKLVTVAGNLDHQAWTEYHKISPLTKSLNPQYYVQQLAGLEQVHFVGANDKVIPPFLVRDFVGGLSAKTKVKVMTIPDQGHCCWDTVWTESLLESVY